MLGKFMKLFVLFHYILETMDDITKESEEIVKECIKKNEEK